MRAVLEHPLGLLPWSLGNSDRTLKKTSKASLTQQLERNVSFSDEIPQPSTCFIDGMSLVQKAHGEGKTFGELSESILVCALRISSDSDRIDVVFDVYRHSSIKYAERVHRGSESGLRFTNIIRGHKVKQWWRMLSSSESKVNFIRFLANDWQMAEMRAKLQGKVLYVTCDDRCYKIVEESAVEVEYLSCDHKEADTRVFVHARHAEEASSAIILASEDTDVFVISLSLVHTFSCPIFMKTST